MPKHVQSLNLLLRAASQNRMDLIPESFDESQLQWVVESGLGPLLRRCVAGAPDVKTSRIWPVLVAADLTGHVKTAEKMDAMEEIARALGARRPPTLLKGISIAGQYYPEPHLRPMGDVDVLVEREDIPTVESALVQMGYCRRFLQSPEFYEAHHHTAPFFHPQRSVWVEVHRGLIPRRKLVGSDKVFSLDNVRAERRPAEFRGRPVYRLSDELQIVYLASHWAYGFKRVGGIVALLDMIYLLQNARSIRWERILEWLDGSVSATPVYLLLTYLQRHGLVELPLEVLGELRRRQRSFGGASLRIVHAMVERYVTNGRDYGVLVSERNFQVVWETLLLPRSPLRRLPALLWNLLPSRATLLRAVKLGWKPQA